MALITQIRSFLKSPPYTSLIFEKELRLKNPKDVLNKIIASIESAGASIERSVLERVSEEIFRSEGKNFYLVIDSSGYYILNRILVFNSGLASYDNFPSIVPYLDYEFWFKKAFLCVIERKVAEIWMVDETGLLFVDLLREDIPKKVRYGGLLGFEENRIRRHIEHHERNYLKDIKETVESLMQANKADFAIVGVKDNFKDEVLSVFKERDRFIIAEIGTDEDREEKFRKALESMKDRAYEAAKSRVESMNLKPVKVEEFVKKLCNGESFTEVFVAYSENIEKLQGFYCTSDFCLDTVQEFCRLCGNRMLKTDNLLDVALFKSYLTGSKINFVKLGNPGIYVFA